MMKPFFCFIACFLLLSCTRERIDDIILYARPSFSDFELVNITKSDRYKCVCDTSNIYANISSWDNDDLIVANFSGNYKQVIRNSVEIKDGIDTLDINQIIKYDLVGNNGDSCHYEIVVQVGACLPRFSIITKDKQSVSSKNDYIDCSIKIDACPLYGVFELEGAIKGRGNATWSNYPKKPYKIKLSQKAGLLGQPKNKDWVLLADYCDKSLLRTSFMVETAKLCGLKYNVFYQHVELFINDTYLGTYILTDQIEKAKERVNIESDGYIFEDDLYFNSEKLWFTTEINKYNYSFKYPNADKEEIVYNDENYIFITQFMNNLETTLYSNEFDDPNKGYRQFIDVDSWARWYLAAEIVGNYEPNLFYVLNSKNDKLEMYPMWDAEWSLGLAARGGDYYGWHLPPHDSPYDIFIWRNSKYFDRLFEDEYFRNYVNAVWDEIKSNIPDLLLRIEEIKESIKFSQKRNFDKWDILGKYISVGLVTFNSWEEEVAYTEDFFRKRVEWLDENLSKY